MEDPVGQNIETIAKLYARAERDVSLHQRAVEAVTSFLGRPLFLYFIWAVVLGWCFVNLAPRGWHWHHFDDPPFPLLATLVSLGGLLMTTVVLITENRQAKQAERRAQLELQISLLAEQKIAKVIDLLEELRRDLPNVQNRHDPIAEAMTAAANPHQVLAALEETLEHNLENIELLDEELEAEAR